MSKSFDHAKFLSAIAGLSLVAYASLSAADAGTVTRAPNLRPPGSTLHISPVHGAAPHRSVRRHAGSPSCTTVPISPDVQSELEENTPTATAAYVISVAGTYSTQRRWQGQRWNDLRHRNLYRAGHPERHGFR